MFNLLPGMDEDQKMMIAASLLSGRGNVGANLSEGLLGAYKHKQGKTARELQQIQLQQAQAAMQQDQQRKELAQRSFAPGQEVMGVQPDGQSPTMAGQGGGLPDYVKGLMGMGDIQGAAQAQGMASKNYQKLGEGDVLIDLANPGSPIARGPAKPGPAPQSPFSKINPADYTPESFRKFAASQNYADLVPYRAPRADDSPKPQLYPGPDGPVWVTPPTRGSMTGTQPVLGPDGKPLQPKKRDQPLTESQAKGTLFLGQMRGAEESIAKLRFKPDTMTAQAQLASALKANEAEGVGSSTMLRLAAGKDAQQYAQAAEQWAEAFLRIKTGAAATRDEVVRNVRTFFPMPGDSKAVIAQKARARADANKQMEILAGGGTQRLDEQNEQRQLEDPLGIR